MPLTLEALYSRLEVLVDGVAREAKHYPCRWGLVSSEVQDDAVVVLDLCCFIFVLIIRCLAAK